MKIIEKLSKITAVLLISFTLVFSTGAIVFAENSGDTQPPTGNFPAGQNIQVKGKSYILSITANDNVGVSKVDFYSNFKVAGYQSDNNFSIVQARRVTESTNIYTNAVPLSHPSTGNPLPDGAIIQLKVKIYDQAGNSAFTKASDGSDVLTLVMVNPTDNSQPPSQPRPVPPDNKCSQNSDQINNLISGILKRQQRRIDLIDKVLGQVQQYYSREKISLSDYQKIINDLDAKQGSLNNELAALVSKSILDCSGDYKSQLKDFQDALKTSNASIEDYRNAVLNLISLIKEAS